MKVGLQTLNGKKYSVEIDEKETIGALKSKIHSELQLGEPEEQKLIHVGKILKDEDTIESCKIKENQMIVVMISKGKKKTPSAAPTSASSSESTSTPSTTAPSPDSSASASAPAPASAPASSPSSNASSQVSAPAAPAAPATAAPAAAAAPMALGANAEGMVNELMSMGFEREHAAAALRAAFFNPDRAAEYLFNGLSIPELRAIAGAGPAGGNAAAASANLPASSPALPIPPPSLPSDPSSDGEDGSGDGGDAGVDGISPPAGLQAIRQLIASNPQMLPILLQQIAQSNPQMAQLIASDPEGVAAILAGAAGGQSGGGALGGGAAGGAAAGGPQVIRISQEEKQQLDNLTALGFPQQVALEAWLICDRNEELAANYLFENYSDLIGGGGGAMFGGGNSGANGGSGDGSGDGSQ